VVARETGYFGGARRGGRIKYINVPAKVGGRAVMYSTLGERTMLSPDDEMLMGIDEKTVTPP
jgi:hypothetical protein